MAAIALIDRFGSLDGWNIGQIAVIYGLTRIQIGLVLAIFGTFTSVHWYVRAGQFDRLLVRPRSVLVQMTGLEFNGFGLGAVASGVGLVIFGLSLSPIPWTWWLLPWVVVIVVSGGLIQLSLAMTLSSLELLGVRTGAASGQIENASWQMNMFPASAFGIGVQTILTFGLPWAFLSFYPSHLLYGRGSDIFIGSPVMYLAPVVAVIAGSIALTTWRYSLRRYQGIGGM